MYSYFSRYYYNFLDVYLDRSSFELCSMDTVSSFLYFKTIFVRIFLRFS